MEGCEGAHEGVVLAKRLVYAEAARVIDREISGRGVLHLFQPKPNRAALPARLQPVQSAIREHHVIPVRFWSLVK